MNDLVLLELLKWKKWFKNTLKVLALLGSLYASFYIGYKVGFNSALNWVQEMLKQANKGGLNEGVPSSRSL